MVQGNSTVYKKFSKRKRRVKFYLKKSKKMSPTMPGNMASQSWDDWHLRNKKRNEKQSTSSNGESNFFALQRLGWLSMVSDKIITEVKAILHNLCVSCDTITRKTVIASSNGCSKFSMPKKVSKECW